MKKYLVAAVLIGAFAIPALAVESGGGKYFVGLDTTTKKCSVVTEMAPGMKQMGEYDSKEAAEKAMADGGRCRQVDIVRDEVKAVRHAMSRANRGDLVVVCVDKHAAVVQELESWSHQAQAGSGLTEADFTEL